MRNVATVEKCEVGYHHGQLVDLSTPAAAEADKPDLSPSMGK
ncbi:hypothetical protein [Endozoicomonas sp. ALC020]